MKATFVLHGGWRTS
ncbi:TPA: trp operon leader peptide [Citrobacter farmeri]|nr:trp operon leader peptide [Pluralibacter sp. S54_ASV_43]HAT3754652.1 trp operon leader peptide [Citrobacter amalonaticus]HAU5705580.1 trp operon leader peptide [Citrobacter freundii]HCB1594411.1 trp operon leader peptide [Citrobacter farmeri]HCB1652534.1 trp operon leader peptide [Citrobacter farmeri]